MSMTPNILTYKFHNFRPSDRMTLKEVVKVDGGEALFLAALEIYLKKWAVAEWLTEYELERIAIWAGAHLNVSVLRGMQQMSVRAKSCAQSENAKQTYSVMLEAVEKELRGKPSMHRADLRT